MSQVWKRQPISALAKHNLGKMLDRAKNRGELRPYLRNLNVRWFDFDLSDLSEMRFEADEVERYSVRKGDLVICEGGYPGRAAVWRSEDPIYFQKALHRVRFHEPLYARWCLYYLFYEDALGLLQANFNGAGIQHFTGESLAKFEMPVPPVQEVTRIVAILDEAFDGIATAKANAEKNLQNARELFNGQLQSTFSTLDAIWPLRVFDSLAAETLIGLTRSAREQGDDLRCRYVKMNNISADNRFDAARIVSVDATDSEIKRYRLEAGDFLFNTRNSHELVGKSCVFESAGEDNFVFNNNIMRVRFHVDIDSQFILYAFSYKRTLEQLESMKSGTTNVAAIYYRDLATLKVPIPDVQTQRQISRQLSTMRVECDRLLGMHQRKLAALEMLKKSLLHQAFTGQL